MITCDFDYIKPADLSALNLILSQRAGAMLLAGGHALLPEMKLRRLRPGLLVDLAGIGELRGIQHHGANVIIGAMVTSADIERSEDLVRYVPLLPLAAKVISDPLIRNRATIGGSLAQADPRGDWPAVALASGATLHLLGPSGTRQVSVDSFFRADEHWISAASEPAKRTDLGPGELIVAISIPVVDARTHQTYLKRMHPASGYAVIGVAVSIELDEQQRCVACRIGITGAGTIATRARSVEERLLGEKLTEKSIKSAASAAAAGIQFVGDSFGSADYRKQLLPIFVRRAIFSIAGTKMPEVP